MAKNKAVRVAGKLIKIICVTAVFSVIAFLIWRAFFSGILPRSMESLIINDSLAEAYEKYDGNLTVKYQKIDEITRVELSEYEEEKTGRLSNYGYFSIVKVDIIPEANQVQVVFRYNNGTIKELVKDYGLSEMPDRSEQLYELSIVKTTDLTPDVTEDNLTAENDKASVREERYFSTEELTVSDTANVYNYRKFVFEGVSIDSDTLALYVDIYYKGDIVKNEAGEYVNPAYGTLCIWDYLSEDLYREIGSDDLAALEARRKK